MEKFVEGAFVFYPGYQAMKAPITQSLSLTPFPSIVPKARCFFLSWARYKIRKKGGGK